MVIIFGNFAIAHIDIILIQNNIKTFCIYLIVC